MGRMSTTRLVGAVFGHTGRGDYGHGHDVCLNLHPNIRIESIADPDPAGREAAVTRTEARRGYADWKELLTTEKPDIVSIACRDVRDHAEQIVGCAEAGVAGILCEKPLAATLSEADRALEACQASGTRLVVAHRRASGYELHARDMIRNGEIGDLVELRGRGKGDHRAGGQDLAVLGPHILDSMRWIAGSDPQWAVGHVTQNGRPVTRADCRQGDEGIGAIAGDALTGLFMFERGLPATFTSYAVAQSSAAVHSAWFGYEVYGTKGALSIRNSPGGLCYHCPTGMAAPGEQAPWTRVLLDSWEKNTDGSARDGHARNTASNLIMVEELVAAILHDRPVTRACTGQDARWALEMAVAIHASHLSGVRLALPLADRGNPYAD